MNKYIPTDEELSNILRMYNEELLGSHTISLKTGLSESKIKNIILSSLNDNL